MSYGHDTYDDGPTVYAGCHTCGHIEPRPAHAYEDWHRCESCHASPDYYSEYEHAAEAIAETERVREEEGRA